MLDIGCGYGDLLRAVRRWARKRGRTMKLIGIDLSPQVIDIARGATDAADDIEYHADRHFRIYSRLIRSTSSPPAWSRII